MTEKETFSIDEVIENEMVISHYQPLVSVKRKEIIGYEALGRGTAGNGEETISPARLILEAERYGLMLELDRLFRKTALRTFAPYYRKNRSLMLSININNSVIEQAYGSRHFIKSVNECGIDPGNIIIEILESEISDTTMLSDFVTEYRAQGFMIAVDDFGSGYSNWDRIILLKPDIVKLDRSIIDGIESDFFKQETARSIIRLSHNTGSLVIAEGVERIEEAVSSLELDADILQGYYMGHPSPLSKCSQAGSDKAIAEVSRSLAGTRSLVSEARKKRMDHFNGLMESIISQIKKTEDFMFDEILKSIIVQYRDMECIYVINMEGVQVSSTVSNSRLMKPGRSRIFYPDEPGTDQSNKEYYYNLLNGSDMYISDPYLSLASGGKCMTVSKKYASSPNEKRILCIDISGGEA